MSYLLEKIDKNCGNIKLLDFNSCMGNAVDILNNNINMLNFSANELLQTINVDSYSTYRTFSTAFSALSSKMVEIAINIERINEKYVNPYTIVKQNSALYSLKTFSVYYPTIQPLTIGYVNDNTIYDSEILDWLNQNFPNELYGENQIINVFVNLSYVNYFSFVFHGTYQENCGVPAHSANTLSCDGCGQPGYKFGLCNHDTNGHHWCNNAYDYCSTTLLSDKETYTCQGNIGTTVQNSSDADGNITEINVGNTGSLSIDYQRSGQDVFIARIVRKTYQNSYESNVLKWIKRII